MVAEKPKPVLDHRNVIYIARLDDRACLGLLGDPNLKTMSMLAKAGQLETALTRLQYKESWRPEVEAWKREHPEGIRKFVDAYGLRP